MSDDDSDDEATNAYTSETSVDSANFNYKDMVSTNYLLVELDS